MGKCIGCYLRSCDHCSLDLNNRNPLEKTFTPKLSWIKEYEDNFGAIEQQRNDFNNRAYGMMFFAS